jgi:hypothetical protein
MKMTKTLYNQSDIYHAITTLFKAPTVRRLAVTAFVGSGAESYLPNPRGLTLVCWPKAGATNPQMLRKLMKAGIEVRFADRLHMKIYWAEGRGCVLTSANLSTNALGSGNLREVGVLLGPHQLDIDRILRSLDARPANDKEMKQLDRAHALYVARNEMRAGRAQNTFAQWLKMPMRPPWKLGWADSYGTLSKTSKQNANDEFGVRNVTNWLSSRKGDFNEGDWILHFMLAKDIPTEITWMFCHRVYQVPRKDKEYNKVYPSEAVQVYSLDRYPGCPFRTDKEFKRAFKAAVKQFGANLIRVAATTKPRAEFIRLLATELGIPSAADN